MLNISPRILSFSNGEHEQIIEFQNDSPSESMTFKIEANCSTRFKVSPIIGVVGPGVKEVVSVRLRENETAQLDDKFLVRSARYSDNDFSSPKEFWAEAKKLPNVIPHEKTIVSVSTSVSTTGMDDGNVSKSYQEGDLKDMQSFYVSTRSSSSEMPSSLSISVHDLKNGGEGQQVSERQLEVDNNSRGEQDHAIPNNRSTTPSPPPPNVDDEDGLHSDEHIAVTLLAAENAREMSASLEERSALKTIAAIYGKRGDHILAAAWLEEALRVPNHASLNEIEEIQNSIDECIRSGNIDEFTLLCAREEVTRARSQARFRSGHNNGDMSPPPPPPPQPPPPSATMSHHLSTKRYAAPTEASLAHRVGQSPNNFNNQNAVNGDDSDIMVSRAKTLPRMAPVTTSSSIKRPLKMSGTASTSSPLVKKRGDYVLEIVAPAECWADRMLATSSCRIALQGPETTVREMKELALRSFRMDEEPDDIDLLIVGVRLSDQWRADEFGLRPGVTRIEMRPSERTSDGKTGVAKASLQPANNSRLRNKASSFSVSSSTGREGEVETLRQQIASLTTKVFRLEEDNARLAAELELRTRDLDGVSAKLLAITRDKERAEHECASLSSRLALMETQSRRGSFGSPGAPSSPKPRSSSILNAARFPSSPGSTRSPKQLITKEEETNASCVVTSANYLVPLDEDEEDFFEDGEDAGPQTTSNEGEVALDNHVFRFDNVSVLTSAMGNTAAERVLGMLPGDLFDVILDGESRTICVVGETSAGKSAIVEGFDPINSIAASPRAGEVLKDSIVSPNRNSRRLGLCELLASQLYRSMAALTAEAAMMGGDAVGYDVYISGFQTFRDGRVLDFLATTPRDEECGKVAVPLLADFERTYRRMLRKKAVVARRSEAPCRGDPTDPESCVVITFELARKGSTDAASRLRVIETCGTETGGVEKNPLIGRLVVGTASVIAVLHPSSLHTTKSVEVCTLALEMAKRYEVAGAL